MQCTWCWSLAHGATVLGNDGPVPGGGVVPAGGGAVPGAVVMTPGGTPVGTVVGSTDGGAPEQHVQCSALFNSQTMA